jgi:pyruvate dehydrogenase E2 component (dihydrolipoamide acetyltransferase)
MASSPLHAALWGADAVGVFTMPSLGSGMEDGTLVEWLKQPGDQVQRGDIIAVVETEKGAIEVEIFESGKLDSILVREGAKVPVGTPLATIAAESEANAATAAPPPPPATPRPEPAAPPVPAPAPVPAATPGLRASAAARRLAAERGISLTELKGSGPGGAIVRADVEGAASAPQRQRTGIDLSQMRRAIAAAMARSKREIPHYYLSHSFDVGAAQRLVEDYNARKLPADRVLFAALLIRATALALRGFPEFNGFHDGDAFQPSEAIHIGFAIALRGGGLAAPAIHDTDKLALPELMARLRDLVGRVRRGGFRSSEISGPTMTLSSLGERGVDALLPVIYPPQVAIIGFGTIRPQPWVVGKSIKPRPILTASLAADHRASDGHRGALLLARIAELLQEPTSL